MALGPAVSVFLNDRIYSTFRALGQKNRGFSELSSPVYWESLSMERFRFQLYRLRGAKEQGYRFQTFPAVPDESVAEHPGNWVIFLLRHIPPAMFQRYI